MSKKLYLAEPTVLYRVHGSNSWLNRSLTLDQVYFHNVRRETYTYIVEQHLGLGPKINLPLDWEFYSIRRPTHRVYLTYVRLNRKLNWRKPLRWFRVRAKLYRHYHQHAANWD